MDRQTAKQGLEHLAMAIAALLEQGLDDAVLDPGPPAAYAAVAARFEALASDVGVLAEAMAVFVRAAS